MKAAGRDNDITIEAKSLSDKQPTLQMAKLDKGAKRRFDLIAIMAVVIGARPFHLFTEPWIAKFIYSISGNTYRPPDEEKISGELLDTCYTSIKTEVNSKLANLEKFYFILDESTDVNSNRMINLSIAIPRLGSFFLTNTNTIVATLNTTFFITWFFITIGSFVKND